MRPPLWQELTPTWVKHTEVSVPPTQYKAMLNPEHKQSSSPGTNVPGLLQK